LGKVLNDEPSFDSKIWRQFSPECIDLVKMMLRKDPKKRPSAQKVLENAWFKNNQQKLPFSNIMTKDYLKRLSVFSSTNKLA